MYPTVSSSTHTGLCVAVDAIGTADDDQAVQLLAGMNGTEVSAMSHDEAGWQLVELGDDIPFEAAYLAPSVVTPTIAARARELAQLHGVD